MISYRKDEHVAMVTIAKSCIGLESLRSLREKLLELRIRIMSDKDIRVVLLNGLGGNEFSLGEDFASVEAYKKIWGLDVEIANIDRPVIAGIDGDAKGLGLEMALACDIRIASNTACFGFPFIKKGLIPWNGGTQRLPRLVGKAKAIEMLLFGSMIDAHEALRIGLVNKIVSSEKALEFVTVLAKEVASKAPVALRHAKEAISKGMDLTLEQGLRLEADLYLLLHTTRDRTEGIRAFQKSRKPEFEGR